MIRSRGIDKAQLSNLKLLAKVALQGGQTTVVDGQIVSTNSAAVSRFPLPLTVGSAVVLGLGALAMVKGHRIVGLVVLALGGAGIGAAAAAPELNAAIGKIK